MVQFNQHIENKHSIDEGGTQQIDWLKLRLIFKKSLPWFGVIFVILIATAILYIRYTKPMYQSNSEIKLDQENQSNILGLNQYEQTSNFALLSSEMELIRSRLFFSKVIETVHLNPQYFTYGSILDDEKYLSPPFKVGYKIRNANIYNIDIDVTILDDNSFELKYKVNNQDYKYLGQFGDSLQTSFIDCVLTLSNPRNFENDSEYYFRINSRESLINYIDKNLSVEPLNLQANTFKISFKDHNLNKAHALVSAIDTIYYNYSLQEKTRANRSKIDYLNKQLLETEKKLDAFESYFEEFTITNQTVDLDEDVKRTLVAINGLDSQRIKIDKKISELELVQKRLSQSPYKNLIPKANVYPLHLNRAFEEFNLLNNDLEKLGLSYKQNTYTFKARQTEVELIKSDILSEINDFKNELLEKLNNLSSSKQRLRSQLINLPSKNTEFNKSKRFYTLNEEMYLSLMQSKNEFEIAIAGSITKIKILSPASLSGPPIYPIPFFAYSSAIILAIVFSFLFAGITYLAHNKIQSLQEIEFLTQATTLGAVPKHSLNGKIAKIVVNKHPKSAVSEALRSIRTNIEFMVPDKKSKVISVTSTIGSEGKTFISTNLAALLAMAGKKSVVVDLDLRKPKIHLAFDNVKNETGVSSILIGKSTIKECIKSSSIEGLDFITAGSIPPNPSELILRKEFGLLIDELQSKYEVVVLDTPPVGLVTDGLLAMQKADLPIYVLKADFSKRSFIQNVNRVLATGQFNNLSLILNATTGGAEYGYGQGKKSTYYES
jgi:tyrosine-protein kinase Etk/Wzc